MLKPKYSPDKNKTCGSYGYIAICILFIMAWTFYTSLAGLSWYGLAPIAQIIPASALKGNVTYEQIIFDLSAVPPLLSIFRKIYLDLNINVTYIINISFFLFSALYLFNFLEIYSKKIIAYLAVSLYICMPATWLYNTYEYDVGLYVSLSVILTLSLFNFLMDRRGWMNSRPLIILLSGLSLSLLSSKWSVLHTTALILFSILVPGNTTRKLAAIFLLGIQFILPLKNYLNDGVFSNSTWVGLNLSMVVKKLPVEKGASSEFYTFYMSPGQLEQFDDCDYREKLFESPALGCRYLTASKIDYSVSKEKILTYPIAYLKQGLHNFKINILEFPDNYINSGMSYERLSFPTYQRPGSGRFYWWALNICIYYLIPILAVIFLAIKPPCPVKSLYYLLIVFIFLNYATMSLVNGIELGRMKFYCFGFLLLLSGALGHSKQDNRPLS